LAEVFEVGEDFTGELNALIAVEDCKFLWHTDSRKNRLAENSVRLPGGKRRQATWPATMQTSPRLAEASVGKL
jgi:hypothetical protein